MIEPVSASAFGLGVFGNFLKNCIETISAGGEAHHAYRHLIGHLKERLNDGRVPANHDLNNAIEQSLLEAARAFALGVATQLDPQPALFEAIGRQLRDFKFDQPLLDMLKVPGRDWVQELLKESHRAHGEHGIEAEFILDENQVTKLLVDRAPDKFQQRVNNAFADWLERHVQNAAKPDCVNDFLTKGWPVEKDSNKRITFYQAFCLFFHEKVKHRPEVVNILLAQTLSNVAENQKALETLPEQVANILKKLNEQKLASFDHFQNWLGDQFAQLKIWLEAKFEKVYAGQAETNRLVTEVKELLQPGSLKEEPEEILPDDIKTIFDKAKKFAGEHCYAEARAKYEEMLRHSLITSYPLSRIRAKLGIASIIRMDDLDAARPLFRECLDELRTTPSERLREDALARLGDLESHSGNLLEAKGLLIEAQEIANRLGDRLRTAGIFQSLAWVADGQGKLDEATKLFDQATELFMAEHQRHDPATEKEAMRGLGACFNNKSITQKHKSDLVGSLSSLNEAVEWYRKSDSQDDLTAALFLLAEAKFADAKWPEGEKYLDESLQISMKRKDFVWASHCLGLRGKLKFSHGNEKQALDDFTAALSLLREHGKPREVLDYIGKVAFVTAKQGLKDEARKLYNEAKELSEKHELWDDYADAILDLSKLDEGKDAKTKRKEALNIAITSLEKLLSKTQVKGRRAFLIGRIGSLYQQLGNLDEALNWLARAKQLFEEIGDIAGVANCLGSFAEIMRKQNNPNEELKTYRQLLNLVQGKPMPHLVAGAKINMGVCLMQNGSFREAEQAFEEADEICRKHHLHEFEDSVQGNLERVSHWIEAHKPAAMDFPQLVRELHELVAFFPEAKDSILRFWYYVRDTELHANCRSQSGLKLLVAEDDTKTFLQLVEILAPYLDLALQAVNAEFPGWGIDFVPYPKDKALPNRVAIAGVKMEEGQLAYVRFMRGGLHWPYHMTSDEATSKTTGKIGCVIFGRAKGLPPQAHELMLGLKQEEIIAKKVLFFPFERPADESRFSDDLRLAKEQTLIPFYKERLPESDEVEVLTSIELKLPIIPATATDKNRRQIAQIKRKLVRLLSIKDEEAIATLPEIAGELDDLMADSGSKKSVRTTAYLLHFPVRGTMESHVALVRHGD